MIRFDEFLVNVVGCVVEKHVRYIENGKTFSCRIVKTPATHHILFLHIVKIGLSGQKGNGREANLRASTIFTHPFRQILAAIHYTFLTVYSANFYTLQIVCARHHGQFEVHGIIKHVQDGIYLLYRLIQQLPEVDVNFEHVKVLVATRLNLVSFSIVYPGNFHIGHNNAGHVQNIAARHIYAIKVLTSVKFYRWSFVFAIHQFSL
ncbi:orf34 [Sucra jujuba nucleopolyhedrovirus]|uniref:Orf34 n=1 Tax=Sucra jujuba nucleopolyhedrovirus TaxID=1563660 RepID=A0A097P8X2_9ABAC|nr:orf34 [Sucra jujuba nucleopolyhedrovirus]AIU41273.1 orf34 [Sucra jujuba nucleopolyhedrovirus]